MSSTGSNLSSEAKATLPQHVAIIMDGNGRWAKQRHLPRVEGHRQGASPRAPSSRPPANSASSISRSTRSRSKWNRPKDEVDALMKYLIHYLKNETPELNKSNVRLEAIGQIWRLPENVQNNSRRRRPRSPKQRPHPRPRVELRGAPKSWTPFATLPPR